MKLKRIILSGLVIGVIAIGGYFAYRVATGRGIKEPFIRVANVVQSVFGHNEVIGYNRGEFTNILFVHHSVGHNLISQGDLRNQFQQLGYTLWDQDYISEGLTRPDGTPAGYSYDIPGDNTDTDGYTRIFQQTAYGLPANALSAFLQHEVIIFKSCYTSSQINDDTDLQVRKQDYLIIRDQIDQHPERVFFLLTSPPLIPAETDAAAARRAHELADWLASPEFISGHPNLFVLDLFGFLTEKDPVSPEQYMLQTQYRNGVDSHPNQLANQQVARLLVDFVNKSVVKYKNQISP